jgi:hypothetical protein
MPADTYKGFVHFLKVEKKPPALQEVFYFSLIFSISNEARKIVNRDRRRYHL